MFPYLDSPLYTKSLFEKFRRNSSKKSEKSTKTDLDSKILWPKATKYSESSFLTDVGRQSVPFLQFVFDQFDHEDIFLSDRNSNSV